MNQHKRKTQKKYKHQILLAAAVTTFSMLGVTGAQASVPKTAAKGPGQARTKAAIDIKGNSAVSAKFTRKGASYTAEPAGAPILTGELLASGYTKDLPSVRLHARTDLSTVGAAVPSGELLAHGYTKDLPSVRLNPPTDASPAEAPAPTGELLARGYTKDLPSVRYQTGVDKDIDSST